MIATRIGATTLALLSAATLLASPANATDGVTPTMQADAQEKMLLVGDLPELIKVDPGWEFTTKIDRHDLKFELCTIRGKAIEAPPAPVMYQVEFGETDLVSDPYSLQENVWQFADAASAQRAWAILQERARLCTGTTQEPGGPGAGPVRQVLSNGVALQRVNGETGIWTHSTYLHAATATDVGEGGYYVAYLVGDAIMTVEYDFLQGVTLSRLHRRLVNNVARTLGERWLADPVKTYPAE